MGGRPPDPIAASFCDALTTNPCYGLGVEGSREEDDIDEGSRDDARGRVDVEMEDADDEAEEEMMVETPMGA